jgi:hypothetical protein
MRIHHLFIAATLLATTASADARPHRIVIVGFEGPMKLAGASQGVVVSLLAPEYDIISAKRWAAALSTAKGRGAAKWAAAAKATGVEAVVAGWVDPDGTRTHALTVEVRDASTGRQIDVATVQIGSSGTVDEHSQQRLAHQLDALLDWVDGPLDSSVLY